MTLWISLTVMGILAVMFVITGTVFIVRKRRRLKQMDEFPDIYSQE
jgi:uncharacterized protein YneF (UPF0154 family)